MPDISVVTPSFNQAAFIERTIRSVLDQELDGRSLEYVIVDGGSTDGTREILSRFTAEVRWVSERDNGQADAVNKGLRMTSGEIIGWLNSDDIYYPGTLRQVGEAFRAEPDLDVVYGGANHIDVDDRVLESYYTEAWSYERLQHVCFLSQPAVFFRRRVLAQAGFLDAHLQYCMDYEYWLRLAQTGARFKQVAAILSGSRLYAENKTLGQRVRVHAEINSMLRQRLGRVPDNWLFNYAHAVTDQWGIARSNGFAFAALVSTLSLWAALRWNRRISRPMLGTVRQWVEGGARFSFKGLTRP